MMLVTEPAWGRQGPVSEQEDFRVLSQSGARAYNPAGSGAEPGVRGSQGSLPGGRQVGSGFTG